MLLRTHSAEVQAIRVDVLYMSTLTVGLYVTVSL